MKQISNYDKIAAMDPMTDADGYAGKASSVVDRCFTFDFMDHHDNPHSMFCDGHDLVLISENLGPVEHMFSNYDGSIIKVFNIRQELETIANSLHAIIDCPSRHWVLTPPRNPKSRNNVASAAILLSVRRSDGLYRYVMRTSVLPCNQAEGRSMPLACADAYRLYYIDGQLRLMLCANLDSVYLPDMRSIMHFVQNTWFAAVQHPYPPTQDLPDENILPPDFLKADMPVKNKNSVNIGWYNNYLYSGDSEWAALQAMTDAGAPSGCYGESTKRAWLWPGESGFEFG